MDETTGKLAGALAAFQAEAPAVPKDKTAKVPTKAGGQYSYSYADLADVAAAAYPILARHGLSFSCCPRQTERGRELVGLLMHESGERLEGSLPLQGVTPQELGSSITYARRYLLGSMTGIVTDADDDGALAQAAKPQTRPKATPKPEPGGETGELITDAQMRAMRATLAEVGLTDRDEILREVSAIIRRDIASSKDLTKREASQVIDYLGLVAGHVADHAAGEPA